MDRSAAVAFAVTSSALWIGDVDTRDGPPNSRILDCSIMVVASPVQTHLAESNQRSVVIPARDLLDATGIGRAYTRLNEEFDLENSVKVFVFGTSGRLRRTSFTITGSLPEDQGSRKRALHRPLWILNG